MEVKFNEYESNLINELYNCYYGKEKFNSNTIEGVKIEGRKIYGLRWDFVKLYFDTEFCIEYLPCDRIAILNALLEDFICGENHNDKFRQEIVKNNLLTKEYIEEVRKDKLFENTFKSKFVSTFTQLRHEIIKEKAKERYYNRF